MKWFCRLFGHRWIALAANKRQSFFNCPRCGRIFPPLFAGIYETELTAEEMREETVVVTEQRSKHE